MTVAQYKKLLKGSRRQAPRVSKGRKWSEPEKRYFYGVLKGDGEYEPYSLRFTPEPCEKHVYTPDFVTGINGCTVFHEVKGTYRLKSQDAARIRFIMASIYYPLHYFVWSKLRKDGRWDVEIFRSGILEAEAKVVTGFKIINEEGVVWLRK